jgi:hypothetical protein
VYSRKESKMAACAGSGYDITNISSTHPNM